jgi:UDP-N-acetylmuramoyl-tripeptide--D-alanyl-D-alanine ligase
VEHVYALAELLDALAPGLGSTPGALDVMVRRVCIDSRQASAGSLFVAFKGERVDGHDYVAQAFAAGAVAALVERPVTGGAWIDTGRGEAGGPIVAPVEVIVSDALAALQAWARARRAARPDVMVVGVTGSVGKTTTKEAIAAVLREGMVTLKSEGNHNNEIGLPLTLMELEPHHQCAVLEMGMYALGEIAALCAIAQPTIGVVTNVGPTHLERLGTIARIATAKEELVRALPEDGWAVLNGDDARVRAMAAATPASVVTYGLEVGNAVRATDVAAQGLEGVTFRAEATSAVRGAGQEPHRDIVLRALGRHAVMAALPAIAIGLVQGLSWEQIQAGLLAQGQGLRLTPRRGRGGTTVFDDAYNASPASMLAALDVLKDLPGRRVAVLGDMLELGAYDAEGHREVGRRAAEAVDVLLTVGVRAQRIAQGARAVGLDASAVRCCYRAGEAMRALEALLRPGDYVLIKASRSMGLEALVDALVEDAV